MAVVLVLYLVAEVAAVWAVASALGFFPTLGLLLGSALLGSWLARREGARAAREFVATARSGRPPHKEVTDGMLIAFGGLLITLPGFVSDAAGLLVLFPPTRALLRRAWLRRVERRAEASTPNRVVVVDSEVVQDDADHPVIEGR